MISGVEDMNVELFAFHSSPRFKRVSFYADVVNNRGEHTGTVTALEVRDLNKDDLYRESGPPLFDISVDAAQKLYDQLHELGYRSSDVGTAGHLKATEKHLEDMRKIAFDQLDKDYKIFCREVICNGRIEEIQESTTDMPYV